MPAAGLVLILMNVATMIPLWPGNVGLVQVAVATPLSVSYGIEYAHGLAFGFGLQAIEASVGIGIGLIFLAQRRDLVREAARDARCGRRRHAWEENPRREAEHEREPEGARVPG